MCGRISMTRKDQLVRATDLDALSCRRSANEKGYFEPADPYIQPLVGAYEQCLLLCEGYTHNSATKTLRNAFRDSKFPLINRGTFYRTYSVDRLVSDFIAEHRKCQIVALGAGSDTRAFRILGSAAAAHVSYTEIDFPEQTRIKRVAILKLRLLQKAIGCSIAGVDGGEAEEGAGCAPGGEVGAGVGAVPGSGCGIAAGEGVRPGFAGEGARPGFADRAAMTAAQFQALPTDLHLDRYHMIGVDLRALDGASDRLSFLERHTPTLLLSECVLCYLTPEENGRVLQFWSLLLEHVSIAMYDPMGLDDAFGRTMADNLAQRGLDLASFLLYPDLSSRKAWLERLGFSAHLTDLALVGGYGPAEMAWISPSEWTRVSRLEMIDEVEEISMLLKHYCLIYAEHNLCLGFVHNLKWLMS